MDSKHLSLERLVDISFKSFEGTDAYRHLYANTKTHEFYIAKTALQNQVKASLGTEDKNDALAVSNLVYEIIFKKLPSIFVERDGKDKTYSVKYIKNTSQVFHVLITAPSTSSDIYKWIFRKLSSPKKELYKAVERYNKSKVSQRDFLHLSHEGGSQISYNMAFQVLGDIIDVYTSRPGYSRKTLNEFVVQATADLNKIIGTNFTKANTNVSFITYRAGATNLALAKQDKAVGDKLKNKLKSLAVDFSAPLLVQAIDKSLLEEVTNSKEFKNSAGKVINRKVYDLSKAGSKASRSKKTTTTESKTTPEQYKAQQIKFGSQDNLTSLRAILVKLNMYLPSVVQSNMGKLGALKYRTGRFAQSTYVTDVSILNNTPNIRYSYMLHPYQTFEPGFAQGSESRDPKILIEKSIRQIVSSMIKNKYNMERVG